jgi:hypothetical protein
MGRDKAIQPPFEILGVNQQIEIYQGEYTLDIEGKELKVFGTIALKWLPEMKLEHSGQITNDYFQWFDEHQLFSQARKSKVLLKTPNGFNGEVLINKVSYGNEQNISGVVLTSLDKFCGKMDKLCFTVANFVDNFGQGIEYEKLRYSGRLYFEYEDFKITFDKLPDFREKYEVLNHIGGFAITHIGVLENVKGETFLYNDIENLLDSLTWLLSFACGRQVGICSIHGLSKQALVFESYQAPIIAKWKEHINWFPRTRYNDGLIKIFPTIVEKLNDNLWGGVLKRVFSWYFDSMDSTYIENKIVAVQIALEILAWTFIVEENEIMDGSVFDKLRASDKLRLMLYELSIPREIEGIAYLSDFKSYKDGSHLFTDIRNEIVHPKKGKQSKEKASSSSKHWVLMLGRQYLELSILRILDYKGKYYNLLSKKEWLPETLEDVPWYSPEKESKE